MTSNPITIAGETLTDQDWPEGARGFERARDVWMLRVHIPYQSDVFLNHESPEYQARCRCHFLDKAAEESEAAIKYEEIPTDKRYIKHKDAEERYLQSAEKWARIGRAK